ncbi:MAG TPA: AI-2E family transporter [Cyclobacteriaceae bacterium]|nr:AI-2E family transporter [Cyclobacteriaceae bacterium]
MTEKRFTDTLFFKALCAALLTGMAIFLLIFFKDLLKPLALGVLVWYMIKAFNGLIEKIKFRGRPLNAWIRRAIALLTIIALIQGSVQLLVANINEIISNYATYQATLNSMITSIGETFGINNFSAQAQEWIGGLNIEGFLKEMLTSTSTLIGNIFLVVIYAIFMVLEENSFVQKMSMVFNSPGQAERMQYIMIQIYHSTNKYMMVKAFVSALTAILGYIVMIIVGVDFAFLWALLIFALNFIPYVGSVISTLLPAIFSILQFGHFLPFIWIFGSIMIIHTVIGNYVEPKVMGKSLNLSPLVVVVALSFWGSVWGLLGMLLSVLFTSIMLITFAQFPSTRPIAIMLTENGDIEGLQVKDDHATQTVQ